MVKEIVFWLGLEGLHNLVEKNRVFSAARETATALGKPLLNAGCGQFFPRAVEESDVNLDIEPRDVPNFVLGDVQNMHMFRDKFFGAAVCSHVLEHVDNPLLALNELHRVADKVFVITPRPWWITAWLWPTHKWVFFENKAIRIRG